MKIEEQIIAYRTSKKITQAELAEKLSITQAMLSQIETGKRVVSEKMMKRLQSKRVIKRDIGKANVAIRLLIESLTPNDRDMIEMLLERLTGIKI